jgi:hypothetical protein
MQPMQPLKNMTLDTHLKMELRTGSRKNMKHHAIGCEWIHIKVDGSHLPIGCTAGICKDFGDQSIATSNGNPVWPTLYSLSTCLRIEHYDVVCSGIGVYQCCNKCPWGSIKHSLKTVQNGSEKYMGVIIPESSISKQQPLSCRISTCLIPWHGNEVRYSKNSPTCSMYGLWPKWPKVGFRTPQWRKR